MREMDGAHTVAMDAVFVRGGIVRGRGVAGVLHQRVEDEIGKEETRMKRGVKKKGGFRPSLSFFLTPCGGVTEKANSELEMLLCCFCFLHRRRRNT